MRLRRRRAKRRPTDGVSGSTRQGWPGHGPTRRRRTRRGHANESRAQGRTGRRRPSFVDDARGNKRKRRKDTADRRSRTRTGVHGTSAGTREPLSVRRGRERGQVRRLLHRDCPETGFAEGRQAQRRTAVAVNDSIELARVAKGHGENESSTRLERDQGPDELTPALPVPRPPPHTA